MHDDFCSFHVAWLFVRFMWQYLFVFLQIKRFQRYLSKCSAADTEKRAENVPTSFSFRKSNLKERLAMRLKNLIGHGDPKDFLMIKFYDWIYKFPIPHLFSNRRICYSCHFLRKLIIAVISTCIYNCSIIMAFLSPTNYKE